MVEGAALEKRCVAKTAPGVRISLSPPELKNDHRGRFLILMGWFELPGFARQNNREFGVVSEAKMCLHVFASERKRRQSRRYLPLSSTKSPALIAGFFVADLTSDLFQRSIVFKFITNKPIKNTHLR